MPFIGKAAVRPGRAVQPPKQRGMSPLQRLLVCLALASLTAAPPAAAWDNSDHRPYIVKNDRGGLLTARLQELRKLRASGRPVEIRGRVCFSTCTMFLGLPQTCISPRTTFGFHGPSLFGIPLNPRDFDYASQVIAKYYPAPLQRWYLEEGRQSITRLHKIRGSDIIRMGIKRC